MWIESPWSSLMWGLSGLFLSQMSAAVGKYIDILATCKSHSTLDKGLFSHFVNRRVGFRWGPGYFEPIKVVLINTKSLPFGHPWLPFASWSHLPTQPPSVFLKFKGRNQCYSFTKFSLVWGASFQALCRVIKMEMFKIHFPPSRRTLSSDDGSV